jgi:hypothetical protein
MTVITEPGKFRDAPRWLPHVCQMIGGIKEDWTRVDVTPELVAEFPELAGAEFVRVLETERYAHAIEYTKE